MAPERAIHARIKARVWQALDREIREQDNDCEALPDGMTVEVDADTDYEPDAVVNCGPPIPDDATAATNPRDVRRLTLGPFGRGQRQALDVRLSTSDSRLVTAGWDSVGVAPCFDGQTK